MNDRNYQIVSKMLQSPNGMIYVTGPTGSGKSNTTYHLINSFVDRKVPFLVVSRGAAA